MPPRRDKAKYVYALLKDAERNRTILTDRLIAEQVGWSESTVATYRTKRWHEFFQKAEGGYTCVGVSGISEEAFCQFQSQKASIGEEPLRPRYQPLVDSLIDKSRESALLAVQVITILW